MTAADAPARVLVVNAGSSSLKLALVTPDGTEQARTVDQWEGTGHVEPIGEFLRSCGQVDAVGHRVVHGGPDGGAALVLDDDAVRRLDELSDLAPLHQPRAIAGITEVATLLPDVPAVAAFDTGFHRTLSAAARTYALPAAWNERWGLRRYGFHGLSHAAAARRGAELVGARPEDLRIVTCHLGAGASLCAVRDGRSVDTTMGFTPVDGLVMATRSGSLDPGLLTWLLDHGGVSLAELTDTIEHGSGLRGLSGTSGDIREVLAGADRGDAACQLALDVFVHSLVRQVAAMAAAAGGLDLLVLTGGIGEHAPRVRAEAGARLDFLGVAVDEGRNATASGDADVSAPGAEARTVVVTAREDQEIARLVRAALRSFDAD